MTLNLFRWTRFFWSFRSFIKTGNPQAAITTIAILVAGAGMVAPAARAQALGSEPFRIVAPFPPGGPVDTLARMLANGLADKYKQTAVVENLPGAAGNIGMDKVKKAKPDGHTLLLIPAGNLTINPTLMPNFPFQVDRDFAPVSLLTTAPNVLVVHPGVAARSARELVGLAKAAAAQNKPLPYASPGVGSGLHLAGELFADQIGADLQHVPYKGTGPALNDLLGGQVGLMFSNLPAVLPHIRSGKLIAIGLTDTQRSVVAGDIPTLAEQGVSGVVVTSWYSVMAPGGTPAAVAEQLAADAVAILQQPANREQIRAQGMNEVFLRPSAFANHLRAETAQWARIIKAKKIEAQ